MKVFGSLTLMQTIALVSGFIYFLQERKRKEKHTPKIFYWVLVQTLVHPRLEQAILASPFSQFPFYISVFTPRPV